MEAEILNLSLPVLSVLVAAAFLAGFIDSMAGGGGLVSLPVILLSGVPAQFALGTNKFMCSAGTAVSFVTYARGGMVMWRVAGTGLAFSLAGSALGAETALYLNNEILGKALLFLLPVAAALTFTPLRKHECAKKPSGPALYLITPAICLSIGFYDGFFGPGTGSFILLALHFALKLDLVKASGTSKAFNLASNLSSLVVFMLNGKVFFMAALPMAAANIAGNFIGARLALHYGHTLIRKVLLCSLLLLFATLFWRYYR